MKEASETVGDAGGSGSDMSSGAVAAIRLGLVAIWLGAWELIARLDIFNVRFTGQPSEIADRFITAARDGSLWEHGASTLEATLIAFMIAVPLGTAAGIALGVMPRVDHVLRVFLVPFNTFPRIALVPLFILWFGLTQTAKVALAVSLVAFLLLFNARAGIRNVDPDILTVSRLLGIPRRSVALKVILPASVPIIFAGVRIGLTYSLLGVVASEMIASRRGLGQLVVFYGNRLDVSGILAVVAALVFIAAIISQALDRLESHLLRWQ